MNAIIGQIQLFLIHQKHKLLANFQVIALDILLI